MFARLPLLFAATSALLVNGLPCDESPSISLSITYTHSETYHHPSHTSTYWQTSTTAHPAGPTYSPTSSQTASQPTASASIPSPASGSGSSSGGQCNTGPVQCCNSVQAASATGPAALLQSLGVIVQDLSTPIGMTCSPIDVLGGSSGPNCVSQPVCCQNNNFNGLVNIGCTPINLAL